MSLPGLEFVDSVVRMPLLSLPVRTTVVQLAEARLLVSPGSMLTGEQLRALGDVTHLVAPSLLHTAGMARAAAVFPAAQLWGPNGAGQKHPDLTWSGVLGEDEWPFEKELSLLPVEGAPRASEFVLLHRASRTVLVMDLAFNLVDASGLGARLLLTWTGSWRRFAVSRIFLSFVKDREAFRRSVARIADAHFDHLVPAHGAIVLDEGRQKLVAALRERRLV